MAANQSSSSDGRLETFLKEARQILAAGGINTANLAKIKKAGDRLGIPAKQRDAAVQKLLSAAKARREEVDEEDDEEPVERRTPVLGFLLLGAGVAVLGFAGLVFYLTRQEQTPPHLTAILPDPPNPVVIAPPPPLAQPKIEPWWAKMPDAKLIETAAEIKKVLPKEDVILEGLGDETDIVRLTAYQKLLAKLPELLRTPQAKNPLERLLMALYIWEPAERNVIPMRDWFVSQIPQDNMAYPPGFKNEELDRSFWALEVSVGSLTHKALRPNRAALLSHELGQALGIKLDPQAVPEELKKQTEKLLALRFYRNLAPTAAKTVDHALTIRESLHKRVSPYLPPVSLEQIDVEVATLGMTSAKATWPRYSALLRECLKSEDLQVSLQLVSLYEQADAEMTAKLDPIFATKWTAFTNAKLDQTERVRAVQRELGVPDPTDRLTLLEKRARESLANTKSPVDKVPALLQETARLSHSSLLACALLQKGNGLARFDEWLENLPEIEPAEKKKEPADDKKKTEEKPKVEGNEKPAIVAPGGPIVIRDALIPGAFSKIHPVPMKRGRSYAIHMVSPFDNYLILRNAQGIELTRDDDSGGGLNALIRFLAPVDGTYLVVATSFGGGRTGPYTLTITEGAGFGMPVFPGRPFPFRGKFLPPPVMLPGGPVAIPGQPNPAAPVEKPAAAKSNYVQVSSDDLKDLAKASPKVRAAAFQSIVAKLKDDLDFTPRAGQTIGKYLVTMRTKEELDAVLPKLGPVAKSRNLLLGISDNLADGVNPKDATQETNEALVGALLAQQLLFAKGENWRQGCRKLLVLRALDLTGKKKSPAIEAATILRDYYKEQGKLLGLELDEPELLQRPSQALENVTRSLAAKLSKQDSARESKPYLDQVPRQLLAAQFAAQNDVELTVLLQRIWLKVLSIHLELHTPQKSAEIRQVQQELQEMDRNSTSVLDQLRAGEEKILRVWVLAHDLK